MYLRYLLFCYFIHAARNSELQVNNFGSQQPADLEKLGQLVLQEGHSLVQVLEQPDHGKVLVDVVLGLLQGGLVAELGALLGDFKTCLKNDFWISVFEKTIRLGFQSFQCKD